MEMYKFKRTRVANFSAEEEETLVELVLKQKEVLECKRTDAVALKAKWKAWEALAMEFYRQCTDNGKAMLGNRVSY